MLTLDKDIPASPGPNQAVYLMEAEAHAGRGREMHIRDRVECLVKAISACHKCDLDSSQVRAPFSCATDCFILSDICTWCNVPFCRDVYPFRGFH